MNKPIRRRFGELQLVVISGILFTEVECTNEVAPWEEGVLETRTVDDVARELRQARQSEEAGLGRAVLLVGAGCSVSAGIKPAAGVAQFCAVELRRMYERGWNDKMPPTIEDPTEEQAEDALRWLIEHRHVPDQQKDPRNGRYDWGSLYSELFEKHLKAPNVQRSIIAKLVGGHENRLNWTHACIGELVARGVVHTVLTTNFDQLVLTGVVRAGTFPVIADGLFAFNRILGQPLAPQIVHLHGSMHTYNLRNTRRAVAGTRDDQGTLAMVHTLLQQCNVLVVVGYAGGEEGLMEILIRAAHQLEELVIYWVAYKPEPLSENAQRLMTGENKFFVVGGDSDKFFYDLLVSMGIGAPRWIGDPVRDVADRRTSLRAAEGLDLVNEMISAYDHQLDNALAKRNADDGKDASYHHALSLHASGDYRSVLELLGSHAVDDGMSAIRLRATAALELAQRGPEIDVERLRAAVADFKILTNYATPRPEARDLLQLVKALQLEGEIEQSRSEASGEGETSAAQIDREVGRFMEVIQKDGVSIDQRDHSQLLYDQATAQNQLLNESEADPDSPTEDAKRRREAYEQVERLYRESLKLAGYFEVEGRSTLEIREGLAGALQAIALLDGSDVIDEKGRRAKAGEAVDQLEKVKVATLHPQGTEEYAGHLFNVAKALALQWDVSEGIEQGSLRQRGLQAAATAADAFARFGDKDRSKEMEELIGKFRDG